LARIYEGMFLLDNHLVREDWKAAKRLVTGTLEKSGAKVHSARRWDERRLAYKVSNRRRGTYLLAYFDLERDGMHTLARDLELSEPILRHLILQADAVPPQEIELAQAEEAEGFSIPAPPPDDAEEELASARADEPPADGERRAHAPRESEEGDEEKAPELEQAGVQEED
jgi:small subunit ribosomal protein S6